MHTPSSLPALEQIKSDIINDQVCPELAGSATQLVFGDGDPHADIMFIGEAPGKNEDLQGKPFVGAAGKFLDEMLAMNNMKRAEIYITNIVKYRPPNNRDPQPDEKRAFMPYLLRQIKAIQPVLVVTLGRHSMEAFLPAMKISAIHGQPKRILLQAKDISNDAAEETKMTETGTSLVVLPLFHPAAALYNGDMRQTLIDDFAKIPSVIKKLSINN